jgi:FlaG/FlaF family flagellin (archaellin)
VTVERVVAWLLALAAMAALAGLVVGPGADYRTATPSVDIEGEYNATAGTVTLTHAGGDELTARSTTRLAVHVTDADTDATTRLTWANESSLPLGSGATFTVDDPRVDSNGDRNFLDGDASVGFFFDDGDTVEVVWTGRLVGQPDERSTTLGTVTIGNTTG